MIPFWRRIKVPTKWADCVSYAQQIKFLAKWLGGVEEKIEHIEAGGATIRVGTTTTITPGSNASVENVGTDANAIFNFGIPRGERGADGRNGVDGENGVTPDFSIGDVITLLPGESATVTLGGTQEEPVLNFGIPQGITGQSGAPGSDGRNGSDGFSPVITITSITGGTRVTVTDEEHPSGQSFDVMDGSNGSNGSNGYSPEVSITPITGGNRITITDELHPLGQSFDVMNGTDGSGGSSGSDGVSPEVTIASITGGTRVTITDAEHPSGQSFDVMNGINGTNGTDGADGTDGITPSITATASVDALSSNNPSVVVTKTGTDALPVFNFAFSGLKGAAGAAGADAVSPTVTIQNITGGTRVTITDEDHPLGQSFDVMNGSQGPAGPGVPAGGTADKFLKKSSSTDYDTEWDDILQVPSGGNNGDVLTKVVSGYMWAPPVGGGSLELLTSDIVSTRGLYSGLVSKTLNLYSHNLAVGDIVLVVFDLPKRFEAVTINRGWLFGDLLGNSLNSQSGKQIVIPVKITGETNYGAQSTFGFTSYPTGLDEDDDPISADALYEVVMTSKIMTTNANSEFKAQLTLFSAIGSTVPQNNRFYIAGDDAIKLRIYAIRS